MVIPFSLKFSKNKKNKKNFLSAKNFVKNKLSVNNLIYDLNKYEKLLYLLFSSSERKALNEVYPMYSILEEVGESIWNVQDMDKKKNIAELYEDIVRKISRNRFENNFESLYNKILLK